jgi:hypothetical protein
MPDMVSLGGTALLCRPPRPFERDGEMAYRDRTKMNPTSSHMTKVSVTVTYSQSRRVRGLAPRAYGSTIEAASNATQTPISRS